MRLPDEPQLAMSRPFSARTFDVDGIVMTGERLVTLAMAYGGTPDGSIDDAVMILTEWDYLVTEFN